MRDFDQASNEAVVKLLGARLERLRLQANITQADLAVMAGISLGTVKRAEGGKGLSLLNLVALLRALGKLSALDSFLPEPPLDPLAVSDNKGRYRQRATGNRKPGIKAGSEGAPSWVWGDEAESN